jgi:endonuclease/exonuclease/phosphatase family metal-dependent hydrolase
MRYTHRFTRRRKESVCIVTYNVHSCIGVDGRCAPDRIAAVIAEMDPDVACLQELDVERTRTGAVDQAAEIARILTMQFHFHATIQEVSGRYGDAILSKTPFTNASASCLPEVPRPLPREARGAIWVETTVDGRPWQIINTHFGLGHGERRLQARALVNEWIRPALGQPPLVVCGDFNSRPASKVHQIIGEPLRDVFKRTRQPRPRTFPTRWPFICLDYVFVSPEVRVERVERWSSPMAARASDHFPVVAEIH